MVVVVVVVVVSNRSSCYNSSLAICAMHTASVSLHTTLYLNVKELKNILNPNRNDIDPIGKL